MEKANSHSAILHMTVIGIFAAFMCITAPWTVPVGPIPITLATFSIYLSSATIGWKRSGAAVAIYLLLGFVGLPVFSGFAGGIQRLIGATGGYLIGYIPMAVITGAFVDKFKKTWAFPIGMIAGTAVLYTFGTAWYCIMSGVGIIPAMMGCVVPFLAGDAIKIAAATALAAKLRPFVRGLVR